MKVNQGNGKFIKFDGSVRVLKYEVLRRVAEKAFNDTLERDKWNIPKEVVEDLKPNVRCCIYKERAIVEERIRVAMGGDKNSKSVVQVIDIACDECAVNRFIVTDACRGCMARKCEESCSFNAIHFINKKSVIDYSKCKECGKCKDACPYDAIAEVRRPCLRSCHSKAISYDVETKKAMIDESKCIQCGACVANCPFGAIMDKSFILDVIKLLKEEEVYAVIAPAVSSQFSYANIGQVVNAIKKLGFKDVVEAALGADMVAVNEFKEFLEVSQKKLVMTSSCCPAFVDYTRKNYPELKDNISTTVSPMIAVARFIKHINKNAKVVFIGPCIAKKAEAADNSVKGDVDYVLTFEELLALLDAKHINIDECEEEILNNGSFYGRIFARSGGVAEAISYLASKANRKVDFRAMLGNGIKECDMKLKLCKVRKQPGNFLEGMACEGGCINGPGTLSHGSKSSSEVDKYGKLAKEIDIEKSLESFQIKDIDLER